MWIEKISEKLTTALKKLNCPVSRIFYEGDADTYITFRMLSAMPCEYCDDGYQKMVCTFSIMLTTKKDYTVVLFRIIELLRQEGINISGIEAESLDIDTKFFYVPIIIKIWEE